MTTLSSSSLSSCIPWPRGSLGHNRWFHNHFPPFSPVLHCSLGLGELQACPFPDVVFPPLPLSALSSSPFQCALQDGLTSENWKSSHSVSTGSQTHASCFYRNVAPLQADRDLPSKNLHRRSPTPTPSSLTDSWLTSMAVVLVMWCFCFTELPAQGADWWADVKLDLLGLTIAPHTYTDMNCALGIALTVQSWMQRGKNHFDI